MLAFLHLLHACPHPKSILPLFSSSSRARGLTSEGLPQQGPVPSDFQLGSARGKHQHKIWAFIPPSLPTPPNMGQWLRLSYSPSSVILAPAASVSSPLIKPLSDKTCLKMPSVSCQDLDQNNEGRGSLGGTVILLN